jgi:hypothetical protein
MHGGEFIEFRKNSGITNSPPRTLLVRRESIHSIAAFLDKTTHISYGSGNHAEVAHSFEDVYQMVFHGTRFNSELPEAQERLSEQEIKDQGPLF